MRGGLQYEIMAMDRRLTRTESDTVHSESAHSKKSYHRHIHKSKVRTEDQRQWEETYPLK